MPTPFQKLATLCMKLESTTKRKAKVKWATLFLNEIEADETGPAIHMLLGKAFPDWDQRVLEVSWATLSSTIKKITSASDSTFSDTFKRTGDIGDATKLVLEEGKVKKQARLFEEKLSIQQVYHTFERISETTGKGSRERKERLLESLLSYMSPLEAKYLVRIMIGEMRTGFHEGLMELAISEAFNLQPPLVQKKSMLTGDIGEVATILKREGKKGLSKITLKLFKPIKPMLAQTANTVEEAIHEHEGETALEYKLDGARIQIHKSGDNIKIYSRRLSDNTESLPEIVEIIKRKITAGKAILEGEVVAVGKDGSPLPFQHLMRRFRRKRGIEHAARKIPLQLYLFDILLIEDKTLIEQPYVERRRTLDQNSNKIPMTKQIITHDPYQAQKFLKDAIEAGHEGLMSKHPLSPYTPGVRGKRWLKIKITLEPLDLVIVAAEYGYGRRHGWLSDYYLAARDIDTGQLLLVGKTFKGLTDIEIKNMTKKLKQLTKREEGNQVFVTPRIVVEVAYNEIQKSTKYKSGLALRFARITRIRTDKDLHQVDTIQKIQKIYEKQFEKKARYS